MVVLILLASFFFSVSSFSQEIYTPDNEIDINVSQEYIISPDVVASGGIVANQFDGFVDPESLPGDYSDMLTEAHDDALGSMISGGTSKMGFGPDGYGNEMVSGALGLVLGASNSSFFHSYGVSNSSFGVNASNIIPSSIPTSITNAASKITTVPTSFSSNSHGIFQFGSYSPIESPYFRLKINDNFQIKWEPDIGTVPGLRSFVQFANVTMGFLVRLTAWFLVFMRVREIVGIFTGGNK